MAYPLLCEIDNTSRIRVGSRLPQRQYLLRIGAVVLSLLGILGESVNPSRIQLASHPLEIHSPIGNAVIDEQHNYWSIDIEHNVCIHNHLCSLYTSNGCRHIEHYTLIYGIKLVTLYIYIQTLMI
jgi:hypothetical protein